MDLDLRRLRQMHKRLPADLAVLMVERAALAMERNGHSSGVYLSLEIQGMVSDACLRWPAPQMTHISQHDRDRITEDGAEAVALAVANQDRGWKVIRRLQRGERADWLLESGGSDIRRLVALEISGMDRGDIKSRLSEKLKQVAMSTDVDERWASVVSFRKPRAALRAAATRRLHGN